MAPQKKHGHHHHSHSHHNHDYHGQADAGDATPVEPLPSTPQGSESDTGADADEKEVHLHEANGGHHLYRHHHLHLYDELSPAEKISNLKQLNDTLLKQVSSSRTTADDLRAKISSLEQELEETSYRADALVMEKNWLEDEKRKLELEFVASKKEALGLGVEKEALMEEKRTLLSSKQEAETALEDSASKLKSVSEQLKEAQEDLVSIKENSNKIEQEVEQLRLETDKLNEEITTLQYLDVESQKKLKGMFSIKQALENDMCRLKDACASAEREVAEANGVIDSLQLELKNRALEREGFQIQLKEAWQQIASLEAQREARIAKERDLDSHIKALEDELLSMRNENDNVALTFKMEREVKGSLKELLESADAKSRGLEAQLDVMKVSMFKLQTGTNEDQQRILMLETQVSSLVSEKAILEETKAALEEELQLLNSRTLKASSESKDEVDKLRAMVGELEQALLDAKVMNSQRHQGVCRLEAELKDLTSHYKNNVSLSKLAMPLAVVSTGSLLIIGVVACLRHSKQN